jgi:RNA polymerase sigma-70 factor, ECF subfamily
LDEESEIDALATASETGDALAIERLFVQYRGRLRRMVALRLNVQLRGRIDPSDVVQDAYAEAVRVMDSYVRDRPLPVYLWLRKLTGQAIQQTHRAHIDAEKRDVHREARFGTPDYVNANTESIALQLAESGARPISVAIQRERMDILTTALEKLPETDREILVLRHFEHLTGPEAAMILGLEHAAVKKRYVRALIRIKSLVPSLAADVDKP